MLTKQMIIRAACIAVLALAGPPVLKAQVPLALLSDDELLDAADAAADAHDFTAVEACIYAYIQKHRRLVEQ